jgi:tetratricopeptide (TPR) repeat protein
MNCHRVEQLLDAFIDREIGGWKSWRITRHLARCAACAAICAETRRLGAGARAWRNVTAPPGLAARIESALAASPSSANVSASPPISRRTSGLPSRRETLRVKHSLGAAIIALVALAWFMVAGRHGDTAYAQLLRVASAYRGINSVHLTGWALGPEGQRIGLEMWCARPYRSWWKRGNQLEVCDGKDEWSYEEGAKTATFQPIHGIDAEGWQRMFDVEEHLERARRGFAIEDLGIERVNGTPLRKLRLSGEGYSERETWWLDPSTNLVRQDLTERAVDPLGRRWSVTGGTTRIDYDVIPPKGLFSFAPPPGVRALPRSSPGDRQVMERLLWDGRVLARRTSPDTTIELLAFNRSERGDLFLVLQPTPYYPLNLILTDSEGGHYASYPLSGGYQEHKVSMVVFFPERSGPIHPGLTYQLRIYLWAGADSGTPAAVFDRLTPKDGPPSLGARAEEFAQRYLNGSLEFRRSLILGLAALREGRAQEAQADLEDAEKRVSNPNVADVHEAYLGLADLYTQAGRRDDARAMLEKAHHAATYDLKNGGTVMKAAESMERLGDLDTARQWYQELLVSREFGLGPGSILKAARKYEQLSGDHDGAAKYLVERLEPFLQESPVLGFGDAGEMGQAYEAIGRRDLALQAYTKGLETTLLKPYRESGGKLFRDDAEKLIAAVRRLGGEAAVNRLTVRPNPGPR